MQKTKVGLIGCGNISGIYAQNLPKFDHLELVACADLDLDRAKAVAEKHSLPQALTVEELLDHPDIGLVVNLTVPAVHGQVGLRALEKGKSVYNEKPLALDRAEAAAMLALAQEKGLRVGCAPDTFLGAGLQTCRELVESGQIGEPVAASAFMLGGGVETWHPNPEFFFKRGGGPLFDMGPYYLTALCSILGPVAKVSSCARISFPQRLITSQPLAGKTIEVETPTHVTSILQFSQGAVGTFATSFDIVGHHHPNIEIYGSEGTLTLHDPNNFNGQILLKKKGGSEWTEVEVSRPYAENSRGLGVADMAAAIVSGRPHRADSAMAYHVLDIMTSILEASAEGTTLELQSRMEKPALLPTGAKEWSFAEES